MDNRVIKNFQYFHKDLGIIRHCVFDYEAVSNCEPHVENHCIAVKEVCHANDDSRAGC